MQPGYTGLYVLNKQKNNKTLILPMSDVNVYVEVHEAIAKVSMKQTFVNRLCGQPQEEIAGNPIEV